MPVREHVLGCPEGILKDGQLLGNEDGQRKIPLAGKAELQNKKPSLMENLPCGYRLEKA